MAFRIYKPGQGRYTRIITFAVGLVVSVVVAQYVWAELKGSELTRYLVYGVPLVVLAAVVLLMFWIVNRPRSADFMIATEGEMKKVSWSSKQEVVGGTKVVIAATLILAAMLWAVDLAFGFFFGWVGVLQVGAGD